MIDSDGNNKVSKEEMEIAVIQEKIRSLDKALELASKSYVASHSLLEHRVDELRINKAILDGKASQLSVSIAYLLAFLGLIITIVLRFMK